MVSSTQTHTETKTCTMLERIQNAINFHRIFDKKYDTWCLEYGVDPAQNVDSINQWINCNADTAIENMFEFVDTDLLEEEVLPALQKALEEESESTHMPIFLTPILM